MKFDKDTCFHQQTTRVVTLVTILALAVVALTPSTSSAQRRKSALGNKKPAANTQKQPTKDTKVQPTQQAGPVVPKANPNQKDEFAPENVVLEVKGEGIELVATWFPPIVEDELTRIRKKKAAEKNGETFDDNKEPGKTTAPFILVHDWTRSRGDLFMLGRYLQSKGHAVIIPDLRGHGDSVNMRGASRKLDHSKFRKADCASAVGDIDQCKRFLQEKNNEGILNIDLLNVVAVGDSAHLAIAWSIADWSWAPIAGIKQGKDVKSLILFSPSKKFAGSSLKKLMKEPLVSGKNSVPLPMLVVWGRQSDSAEDCSEFIELIRKFRPEAPQQNNLTMRWAKQNLFHLEVPTAMKGYELAANPQAREIWDFANNFVAQKVMAFKNSCPWQIRGADAVLKAREEEDN